MASRRIDAPCRLPAMKQVRSCPRAPSLQSWGTSPHQIPGMWPRRSVVSREGSTACSGAGSAEWGGGDGAGILSKSPITEQLLCLPREPSQFTTTYCRCTREHALLKPLNELDSSEQNGQKCHIKLQVSPLGNTRRKLRHVARGSHVHGEGSGPSCRHAKGRKSAF